MPTKISEIMELNMKIYARASALTLSILLISSPAVHALELSNVRQVPQFGTVDFWGQNREHEMITRAALNCAPKSTGNMCVEKGTLDQLAGKKATYGGLRS
jgi:hypothetical protein